MNLSERLCSTRIMQEIRRANRNEYIVEQKSVQLLTYEYENKLSTALETYCMELIVVETGHDLTTGIIICGEWH